MSRFVSMFIALFIALVASSTAMAQAAAPQGGPPALMQMVPLLGAFALMYFLMIRPQARKAKMHQEFQSKLKRGDEVLTSSGLLGRIEGITDLYVTLEVAPSVRIRILRSQIASYVPTVVAGQEVKA